MNDGRKLALLECPMQCSQCLGDHHWLLTAVSTEPDEDDDESILQARACLFEFIFVCKHCDAWWPASDDDDEDTGPQDLVGTAA